ncbi:MAG: hypothetical protein ACFB4I_02650 [Cyanophyceae cyanobacterium]
MRYSLLSRFQGGFLGSQIGLSNEPFLWSQVGMATAESLIATQRLTFDWLHSEPPLLQATHTASSSEAALATFPVCFYFHDSLSLLRNNLEAAAAVWLRPSASLEDLLTWGYTLALILREQLDPRLGPDVLRKGVLLQLGRYVGAHTLLEQLATSDGGESVKSPSGRSREAELTVALDCFLTTPEDFRLCVQRSASKSGSSLMLTRALAGSLAGTYNSLGGIPSRWRYLGAQRPATQNSLALAKRLFAAWSGVDAAHEASETAAIASAQTIQRRATLKILSQEE